ncbi:hypothetical protein SAY86_005571 [Trapa natans]|uniref:Uncharacterized protein n=1 Tax=Trapa natans TaxID=22666 RepID=A0AAN7QVK9_TRANT|nr:hypothetical protein SAY86_005571 [Trapa natans]
MNDETDPTPAARAEPMIKPLLIPGGSTSLGLKRPRLIFASLHHVQGKQTEAQNMPHIASEPFMILSLLHEVVNMLQNRTKG